MKYVLGLDLGTASLGWAVLECTPDESGTLTPHRIERTGVRIFEAGVEGDVEQGRDTSRAAKRREARAPRRQNWRTQQRKKKLFRLLQKYGLLPVADRVDSAARKEILDNLDKELTAKHIEAGDHAAHQHLPYLLRSLAVKRQLEPYELGRAIYNLAQRRGFLSNRKADTDETEDGVVKAAISDLETQMNGRTLAQMFVEDVRPDHEQPEQQKIRKRYTSRRMFHDEFADIRKSQTHLRLSEDDWDEIHKAIFFQRPLKSQRHRIGRCEIDGGRRCLDSLDVYQQFRIWNTVQNLRLADAWMLNRDPKLTLEEQRTIAEALQTKASMTWTAVLKLIGFKKGQAKFTIQEWNSKGLIGHRTNQAMINVFRDDWLKKPVEERDVIAREVVYFRKPLAMKRRGVAGWGLSPEQADLLPGTRLEEGHARHSAATLSVLVERMSNGEDYSSIRKDLTGKDESEPVDFLPPISECGLDITNPAVIRGLTELRKVVNELVRLYGKPAGIRIEMARSLKNSRDKRIKIHRNNEDRRKRREKAVEGILSELGGQKYSGVDIEKWLLAEECGWQCPYTGKSISPKVLLGNHSQFDIEHIWPRRYLDNSFSNKTLCCADFNRNVKGNQTAFDACSGRDDWEETLQRVSRFDGPVASLKKKRFLTGAADIPDDFTTKHLNDTRYNAVVAKKYLGMLYGNLWDADGNQRVYAVTGGHTAVLRRYWQLNSILSDGNEKSRDDHRHHAIDAVVVALTDPVRIQALVNAAQLATRSQSKRFYEAVQDPWPGFSDEVEASVDAIVVSHRPTRTLPGALHAESLYSKPHTDKDGNESHRIRKHITKLSATELKKDRIVDPTIRRLVNEKLAELGETNPAKAFAEEKNHPRLTTKDGRKIPIHKVRVFADKKPRSIGDGPRQRFVGSGKDSNFASMIYAVVDDAGNEVKWEHKVITRLEAHERKSRNKSLAGEKVLLPDPSDFDDDQRRVFKFALVKNDTVILQGPDGEDELYRVQKLSEGEIQLCPLTVPSIQGKARSKWNQIRSMDNLRQWNLRLADVTPSGKLTPR